MEDLSMIETILTKGFCLRAISKSQTNPSELTAEQARYLIYFQYHLDECGPEGSIMRLTCDNPLCVAPHHVEIIPPKEEIQ
jgi:hypothetical protein